jgi:hypothetical protein
VPKTSVSVKKRFFLNRKALSGGLLERLAYRLLEKEFSLQVSDTQQTP